MIVAMAARKAAPRVRKVKAPTKARWANAKPDGRPVEQRLDHWPLGKEPAANCACRNVDSTARFTITINGHTLCSWCGGDYELLEPT